MISPRPLALVSLLALCATPARAQDPPPAAPALPPGHPPTGGRVLPQVGDEDVEALPPGHPPTGPAEAMQRIGDDQQRRDQQRRQGAAPTSPQDALHQILRGETPEFATAAPNADLAPGSIRVTLVDGDGAPIGDATVDVGILVQGGSRDRRPLQTDAAGVALFEGLETGSSQAYRVNARQDGATTSCTPFQLPPDRGYDVHITRLATTRESAAVMQLASRVFLELRDQRVHVVQMARLLNQRMAVYLLPEDGKLVRLPAGFKAFQAEPVMTDQRLEPTDAGFRLKGSLQPGYTDLIWGYDLPLHGTELQLELPLPWRAFEIEVQSDAPPGLKLDVDGLPEAEPVRSDAGHSLLVTGQRFRPDDPQPSVLKIRISGVPGPGPLRWVALGAAAVLLLAGFLFLLFSRGSRDLAFLAEAREARRAELLGDALEVERMFASEDVGPKYRARRMDAIADELASLLREEATAAAAVKISQGKAGAAPGGRRKRR